MAIALSQRMRGYLSNRGTLGMRGSRMPLKRWAATSLVLLTLAGAIAALDLAPAEAQVTFPQITNTTGGNNRTPSINADGTRIAFVSDCDLTGGNIDANFEIFLATLANGPRVDLEVAGSGPGPQLINPVMVTYSIQGCSGKEMFLALNAPAMGLPWSYLSATGWMPLPVNLSDITPYASGPADGTYTLFSGTAPTGAYELYLDCDFVSDGHLNIDTSTSLNLNGVYDNFSVTVVPEANGVTPTLDSSSRSPCTSPSASIWGHLTYSSLQLNKATD